MQPIAASGATSVPFASMSWNGVSLSHSSAAGFSQSITPKYDSPLFSWFFHTPCVKGSLCFENGIVDGHRVWTRVENTDQYLEIGNTKCVTVAAAIYPEVNKKSLDCMTPMEDFTVGNTYEFSLRPDAGDGHGNWWIASYRDQTEM